MMKYLKIAVLVFVASSLSLLAGSRDVVAREMIETIRKGLDNQYQIEDLRVKDNVVVGGDVAVTGNQTVTGNQVVTGNVTVTGSQVVSGLVRSVPTALSVTNAQAVTVAEQDYLVTPADVGVTNTITLADPGTALLGLEVTFHVDSAATNAFGLADTGNLKLGGAFVGGASDNITLYASKTNEWEELSRKDN